MEIIPVCITSTIPLQEVLQVLKDTVGRQANMTSMALEIWLATVEQLPQHPVNPHTAAAAVEAVQAALQQSSPRMLWQDRLAWLKQYIPSVCKAIAAQLDKQLEITSKRIDILEHLGTRVQQPSVGTEKSSSRQSAARAAAEQRNFALLECALQAFRMVGPMALLLQTWEGLLAQNHRQHMSRREQLSHELDLVNVALARMAEGLWACADLFQCSHQVCMRLDALYPDEYVPDPSIRLSRCKACFVATAAADCWLLAAVRLPAHAAHHISANILSIVDWTGVVFTAPGNPDFQAHLARVFCAVMIRQDMWCHMLEGFESEQIGCVLDALGFTKQDFEDMHMPEVAQQQLLTWMQQAAPQHGSMPGVHNASVTQHTVVMSEVADTGNRSNDMQELLNMMYGLSGLDGKQASS